MCIGVPGQVVDVEAANKVAVAQRAVARQQCRLGHNRWLRARSRGLAAISATPATTQAARTRTDGARERNALIVRWQTLALRHAARAQGVLQSKWRRLRYQAHRRDTQARSSRSLHLAKDARLGSLCPSMRALRPLRTPWQCPTPKGLKNLREISPLGLRVRIFRKSRSLWMLE